ncbi:MAG: hypothetical protein H6748_06085 [Spirochaetaceae bacterium]|nr:hypothetical protein [Spirochaetaceae bacterium]HPG25261.1 hypothetical protein [Myxococcota bacterium]
MSRRPARDTQVGGEAAGAARRTSPRSAHARPRTAGLAALTAVVALTSLAGGCPRLSLPSDLALHGDWLDPFTGEVLEGAPGVPMRMAGPDRLLGTRDDQASPYLRGDLDLVVRAGSRSLASPAAAAPAPIAAVAAPDGVGTLVDYTVGAVHGWVANPLDAFVDSPSLEGRPIVVAAFGDLDGDGHIGPTTLDGVVADVEIEEAELEPLALQLVHATGGRADGTLRLLAGGPAAAPLRLVLVAAAFTGETDPAVLGGVVPVGPMLMTSLPFQLPFDRTELLDAGPGGPEAPSPDRPLGLRLEPQFPDPALVVAPLLADGFALRLDGSDASTHVVESHSGEAVRFGVVRSPTDHPYEFTPRRVIRRGVDAQGLPRPLEIADTVHVPDDGPAAHVDLRVVPLDGLGNVADLDAPRTLVVSTGGLVSIVSPDLDADPYRETLVVADARGTAIVLDDAGGALDDGLTDLLVIESAAGGSIVDLVLPDPDVDDSGLVDANDRLLVLWRKGLSRGEPGYEARYDVDGNGRIDGSDDDAIGSALGTPIAIP